MTHPPSFRAERPVTEPMDESDLSDRQRERAYRLARQASDRLDIAAEFLGAEDMHDLANQYDDADLPNRLDNAIRALTDAHSYLNNGEINGLVE